MDDIAEQLADALAFSLSVMEQETSNASNEAAHRAAIGGARQALARYWEMLPADA